MLVNMSLPVGVLSVSKISHDSLDPETVLVSTVSRHSVKNLQFNQSKRDEELV